MGAHEAQPGLQLLQGLALRRPSFRSCEKKAKPKAAPLGTRYQKPFLLYAPKETVRFRLTASFFMLAQKETKNAPGVRCGRPSAPKDGASVKAPIPPGPRFTGVYPGNASFSVRRGVSRCSKPLFPAPALLAVVAVRRALDTRLLPRRRKVRSTPFPPEDENHVRSLAPPLPAGPASLGFGGGPFGPARRSAVGRRHHSIPASTRRCWVDCQYRKAA